MDNPRPEKVAVVDDVRGRLESSQGVLLTEYRGLSVADLAQLRGKLAELGGDYKVYKNTLVKIATKEFESAELDDMLNGPTALAFVRDDIAQVARAIRDFARSNPALVLKGGILDGRVLSGQDAQKIANLEPRAVMLAKLAGLLQAPIQQFAGLLQAPIQQFAGLIQALIDNRASLDSSGTDPVADGGTNSQTAESSQSAGLTQDSVEESVNSDSPDESVDPAEGAQQDAQPDQL